MNISGSSILPLKYLGHHTESRHNIMQQRSKLHYIPLSEKLKKALHLAFGSCKHFQQGFQNEKKYQEEILK